MIGLLKINWWKFLSIPLLLYALIAGMLIPLGPGIVSVNPSSVTRGATISFDVAGYNTHFDEDDRSLNVLLKNENNLICASNVTVIGSTLLNVEFGIPPDLRTVSKRDFYNLVIYNETDGTFFLRNAFSVQRHDEQEGIGFNCTTILKNELPKGVVIPYREILYESIRNLFFHVPMWFTMIFLMFFAFICSIIFLATNNEDFDLVASTAAAIGLFFGLLGILTGMVWANFTWGAPWVNDPKLNGAAVGMLIYLAYFVLRGSLNDDRTRARVSSVYSVFAFVIFIVFIFIIPRLKGVDSLHPGSGGNPGFNMYDLDNTMRPVFYSAVLGFIILGMWMTSLVARYRKLFQLQLDKT